MVNSLHLKALLQLPYPITVVMMYVPFLISLTMSSPKFAIDYWIVGFILMFSFIGSFNTLNAISDISLDKITKPFRPLPNDILSVKWTYLYFLFLTLLALFFSFIFFNILVFYLTIFMFVLSILYSKLIRIKRVPILSTFIIAITYSLYPLLVGWSVFSSFNSVPYYIFSLIFVFGFVTLLGKDFEDYEADLKYNIKSLVVIYGKEKTINVMLFLYGLAFLLLVVFVLLNLIEVHFLFLLLFILPLIYFFNNFKNSDKGITNSFDFFKNLTVLFAIFQILIMILYLYLFGGVANGI